MKILAWLLLKKAVFKSFALYNNNTKRIEEKRLGRSRAFYFYVLFIINEKKRKMLYRLFSG